MIEQSEIFQKLGTIMDPELERDIVALDFISGVDIEEESVVIRFCPDTIACPILGRLVSEVKQAVLQIKNVKQVDVLIEKNGKDNPILRGNLPFGEIGHLNRIHKVIAVMSGKCRARKCMVSSFMAIYLRKAGYEVGLLDMDISGRNICRMFFPQRPSPQFTPRAMLPAMTSSGIRMMSLSVHLPDDSTSLDYQSPIVKQKIKELLTNVFWGDLDYLIVDMPSGTSDLPKEILQTLQVNGVILVTTPQDMDGLVIKKVAAFVQQSGIQILGMIENLSDFDRSQNKFIDVVNTPGHFDATAKFLQIPILGRISPEPDVAILCDQGRIEDCKVPVFEEITNWLAKNV
jgi:Mrp family chromosome partitioning ATPase